MASIRCAHCKNTHTSVQEVRECSQKCVCPQNGRHYYKCPIHGEAARADDDAKLNALIQDSIPSGEDFLADWFCGHTDKAGERCELPLEETAGGDKVHVNRLIDLEHDALALSYGQLQRLRAGKDVDLAQVKRTQERGKAKSSGPVTEGYYKVDDTIYKVQKAVHASGHLYAKELVLHLLDYDDLNETQKSMVNKQEASFHQGKWEYAKGAIRHIRAEHKLSMQECIQFGQLYGVCVRCGLTLTKEESIARGMGDVCAGKGLVI